MENKKVYRTSVFGIVFLVILCGILLLCVWKMIQNWDGKGFFDFLRVLIFVPFLAWLFFICATRVELYDTYMIVIMYVKGHSGMKKIVINYNDVDSVMAVGKTGFVRENSFCIKLKGTGEEICVGSIKKYDELLDDLRGKGINVIEQSEPQLKKFSYK